MRTNETHGAWNEIAQHCKREGITLSEFAREVGLERTRVHRLRHAISLSQVITVRELHAIVSRYPNFLINY
jgi:hypothetical protein